MSQIEWGLTTDGTMGFKDPQEVLGFIRYNIGVLTVDGKPLAAHLSVAAAACDFRASEFSGDDDDFDRVNAHILRALTEGQSDG